MKLRFQESRISKINKKRVGILVGVFFVSLIFFNIVLNKKETTQSTTDMASPTLPIVTMEGLGRPMSELHGYRSQMDACYMRDAVIPLGSDRRLPITIDTYGYKVDGIFYEIRSLDTTRKIAETEITEFVQADDMINITPTIENLIEDGEEYLLVLKLTHGDDCINYYTRILIPQNCFENECLDFATNFHNTALSDSYESLATFIEPTGEEKDSLSEVNIHSSIENIGWKNFSGSLYKEPVVEMKDVNPNYSVIVFYYMMKTESGKSEKFYNVEEYFKVRYTPDRMYLLDYRRNMDEILDTSTSILKGNILNLGTVSGELNYLSNETGSIVAFIHSGSLYEYNQNTGELVRIFGFRGEDLLDVRTNYDEHNILILNIDESGTMDFVVYGYMNAGSHEGECGINLYHYDSVKAIATEQVFIPSSNSYQILNARFSNLLYLNTNHVFYIMVDGTLLQVDLDTLTTKELVSSLSDDQYASSKSSRYFAWMDEENVTENLHVMDLETGETFDSKGKGEYLRPVDFIDENLILGYVRPGDVATDAAGVEIYPMHKLSICEVSSGKAESIKDYEKSGYYVLSAQKETTTLILKRIKKEQDGYVATEDDTIRNTSGETNKEVDIAYTDTDTGLESLQITMSDLSGKKVKYSYATAKAALADERMIINISTAQTENKFFSYVGSEVIYAGSNVQSAIIAADEQMGIVVDSKQRYIWKRGKISIKSPIRNITVGSSDKEANSSAQALSAMLVLQGETIEVNQMLAQGQTPLSILSGALKDCTVLDLSGCSLSEVLYYVSLGEPVYARTGENAAVLIIGYDALNITVFNPETGENQKIGMNDATALFEGQGNVFISYLSENK